MSRLLVCLCATLLFTPLTAQTITVHADRPGQPVTLMGGDMERSAHFLDQAANPQEIADWYYRDIRFDFCRVSFDKQQELGEGKPNWAFYDAPISAMKKVQRARPAVKFWATPKTDYDGYGTENNLPDWIYTGGGHNGGNYDPTRLDVPKYARFLADYLRHMHAAGVPISVLSVSKEWQQVFDAEREKQTIDALTALLATPAYRGVTKPLFSGPASWGVKQGTRFVQAAQKIGSLDRYVGICAHSYDNPTEEEWGTLIRTANAARKPVWHEESNIGGGGRLDGAEPPITNPIRALLSHCQWYRQGLQGELFFENWSRGLKSETRAVYFTKGQPGVRLRGYYLMKQFANHAAGARYLPTSTTQLKGPDTMAFRQGNQVILWVINPTAEAIPAVACKIDGATLASTSIQRLAWDQTTPADGSTRSFTTDATTAFTDELGPMTIASYVFTLNP